MGQRRSTESVRNFVIFLLILQNCGEARTHLDTEAELRQKHGQHQRRDGLAKLEFISTQPVKGETVSRATSGNVDPDVPLNVFNFATIYETLYAQLMQTAAGNHKGSSHGAQGRALHQPQTKLQWMASTDGADPLVVVTSPKPFHAIEQLHHDLEEQRKHKPAGKPFSILDHLTLEQAELLRKKTPNVSFNILQALAWEQDMRDKEATTLKPFHVVQQLHKELQSHLKHTTTSKPFSIADHLAVDQMEQLAHKTPNATLSILQALAMEQDIMDKYTTTVRPFNLGEQLDHELDKEEHPAEEQEEAFEVIEPVAAPLEQHKSVPEEATRAKDSQKRKRKRIRRRRKRIRRRRKRQRRRRRKKRKKKRKKRKKKKGGKDKKKKRKKRKQKPSEPTVLGQQAHLIYANPTKHPYHYPHHDYYAHPQQPQQPQFIQIVTTKRPATTPAPFSKIKFLLRHNTLFKKKKKEWFNHVGHVLYPFIKFVAFFTVLNPFTLGVFLFTLVSPVVFGFLGFVALSLLVKPFLHLVFGVKQNVDAIDHQHYLAHKRAEQLKLNLRPVTIHKHYYQQKPLHSTPPHRYHPHVARRREGTHPLKHRYNPMPPEFHGPFI